MEKWGLGVGLSYMLEDHETIYGGPGAARRLKSCLIRRFGFKDNNITLLIDEEDRSVGTARNILQELKKMKTKSKPGDKLLFFYIGHGGAHVPFTDDISNYYMICANGTQINGSQLLRIMNKVWHDRNFTLIMDFCFSGGIFQGLAMEQIKPCNKKVKRNNSLSSNAIMVTSCRRNEFADVGSVRKRVFRKRDWSYIYSKPKCYRKGDIRKLSRVKKIASTAFVEAFRISADKSGGAGKTKKFVQGIVRTLKSEIPSKQVPQLYCSEIQANLQFLC